ncbi:MAG: hypothetical protein NVS1B2_27530 [Vulcanimicrobiaceae bacterium]
MVEPVFTKETAPSHIPSAPVRRRAPTDWRAADRLVADHYYLCQRGSRKFWRSGLERGDLEQVAAVGLIKAARRYDAATRTPFEAYAWVTIVGELMHHVRDHERLVRLPRSLGSLERRFARAHETLLGRLGREPSDADLACELGVLVPVMRDVRRTREAAVAVGLDGLESRACAEAALDPDDRMLIDLAFRTLTPVERRIIVGVYVLGLSQLEIGRRLGLSPKRVSRAHHGALQRMHRAWAS